MPLLILINAPDQAQPFVLCGHFTVSAERRASMPGSPLRILTENTQIECQVPLTHCSVVPGNSGGLIAEPDT